MTQNERNSIKYLIADLENPVLPIRSYPEGLGGPVVTHNSIENIKRLLESPDFKAGWNACYQKFSEALKYFMVAKNDELRQHAKQSLR